MQQLRAHVAVCRGWDLRPQLKMGEREVANIQVIITPTGVDRDTALSLDGTEMVRPENTIQIVPTANRMVIAKLLEKLQLHFPSFTTPKILPKLFQEDGIADRIKQALPSCTKTYR